MSSRRFPGSAFGPLHLRRFLRRQAQPGERIIGWGVAQSPTPPAAAVMVIAVSLVPGLGPAFAGLISAAYASPKRILILTNRRLFVLRNDRYGRDPEGAGIVSETPLADLGVVCGPKSRSSDIALGRVLGFSRSPDGDANTLTTKFTFVSPSGPIVEMDLPKADGTATERLRDGLELLAREWLREHEQTPTNHPQPPHDRPPGPPA